MLKIINNRKYLQMKEIVLVKSNSFRKVKLFGLVVLTFEDVKLIKYIQFFLSKKRIRMIKYICMEFDIFTGSEW